MAKRLTDTKKWENKSFRKLAPKYKLLYLYFLDCCDNAGVFSFDLELICLVLNLKFSLEEIKEQFTGRVIFLSEDKLIIKNYIAFQNGDVLDSKSSIAKSIRTSLNSHGLLESYKEGKFGHVNKAVCIWDS